MFKTCNAKRGNYNPVITALCIQVYTWTNATSYNTTDCVSAHLLARQHAWRPFHHSLPGLSRTAHDWLEAAGPCSSCHPDPPTHGSPAECPMEKVWKERKRMKGGEERNSLHIINFIWIGRTFSKLQYSHVALHLFVQVKAWQGLEISNS